RLIGPAEIRKREPHILGTAAIEVPSTGIVSAEELVHAYARVAAGQGAEIVTHARVVSLEPVAGAIRVGLRIGDEDDVQEETIEARCVINAAGLYADEVAALLGNTTYRIYPVRGEYAEVGRARAYLVNALVYPLPLPDHLSLGMHLTRTLWGTVLVGPTARYVDEKDDYERDRLPLEEFLQGATPLLPELTLED